MKPVSTVSKSPAKDTPPFTDDKVKIIIRLRPIIGDEQQEKFVQLQDAHTLKILRPGNHSHMRFNNILNSNSSQSEMFQLIRDSIDNFLDGVNNTIFAYGQTGAGKTYSIIGDYSHLDSRDNLENYLRGTHKGVLSRSLEQIFYETKRRKDYGGKILISFIELYNQKIFDLINPSDNALDIRQSKQGDIEIIGVLRQDVNNLEKAIELVATGLKNRVTGSTHANSKSSRSHSIFQITYEKFVKINGVDEIRSSSLKIVDLAGSEKYKIPCDLTASERDARVQQLRYINSSLSCLGHCISALIQKSRTHIPFRDSKLTRILSDSLVGPGKMKFIVCISPSITASAQTFSTLQFASRAKKAILDRIPKHLLSKKSSMSEEFSVLKQELQKEKELRTEADLQLKSLRQKLLEYQKENKSLRRQNEELKLRMRHPNPIPIGEDTSNLLKLSVFKQNKELVNKNVSPIKPPVVESQKKMTILEQKKQKFDKRIQTFIEKQSPTNSVKIPAQYSFGKVEYSFQPENPQKSTPEQSFQDQYDYSHNEQEEEEQTFELYEECQSLFRSQTSESSNFIEKTCKNMNVKGLGELKEEMMRAKNQLKYFQQKDSYLEGLKVIGGVRQLR